MAEPVYVTVGIAICKALGIDPSTVKSLSLNVDSDSGVTLEIRGFVGDAASAPPIAMALQKFELCPPGTLDELARLKEVSDDA